MRKKRDYSIIILIGIIFVIGIVFGLFLQTSQKAAAPEQKIEKKEIEGVTKREIIIVGVDSNGKGVSAIMGVEVKPGTVLVLVNINNLLADYQNQLSARTSAEIAGNITRTNLNTIDVIYSIKANASIIEGPSAGAAMTVATIAALENKEITPNVMITGTIEKSGAVDVVGGIKEKARAAKEVGARTLIIPAADYITNYQQVKACKNIGNVKYCEVTYVAKKEELDRELGIKIVQIQNIEEAIELMIK